ncbi:hypothetical protein [Cohnella sp. GbtcB17]|uniref:hypothetical protein n=1 Tax=Cohnella sp. GbtcB17 TaxID=2824762 RepID=UPI001C2FCCF1|nr:hypothetical protein [Cohnella sp. GbtcB17]
MKHLTSTVGDYGIQIDITDSMIQILVAHAETYELYAWMTYLKKERRLGIHHRRDLLAKFLNDLILLGQMDII